MPEDYNETAVYEEKIQPVVDELLRLCQEHNIPMLTAIAHARKEGEVIAFAAGWLPPDRTPARFLSGGNILMRDNPHWLEIFLMVLGRQVTEETEGTNA